MIPFFRFCLLQPLSQSRRPVRREVSSLSLTFLSSIPYSLSCPVALLVKIEVEAFTPHLLSAVAVAGAEEQAARPDPWLPGELCQDG